MEILLAHRHTLVARELGYTNDTLSVVCCTFKHVASTERDWNKYVHFQQSAYSTNFTAMVCTTELNYNWDLKIISQICCVLNALRGDSKLEMGDVKCPLDVRGGGTQRPGC